MAQTVDLGRLLADVIARVRYEDLAPEAVSSAKKSILDTLGVVLAASGAEPAVHPMVRLAQEADSMQECTIFGFGGRTSAPWAAFANGAMAHALDFDDRTSRGAHSGSSLIPAALAMAEHARGVCGKQFIAAVAAGQDLFVRLRFNVGGAEQWNLSSVLGVFAATATAASVLGLSSEQVFNAFGLASMQCSGTMQVVYGGGQLRGMYAGFTAQAAVQSVLLAQKGVNGIDGVFEGEAGVLRAYFAGNYNRSKIISGLGRTYLGRDLIYKPWPVVGLSHPYIHATLELMRHHDLVADDVHQIRVFVSAGQRQMCHPLEQRRSPSTAADAKFSLPFCIALAVVRGRVALGDFTSNSLWDPQLLRMTRKVMPIDEPNIASGESAGSGRVQIETVDGRCFELIGDAVPGSPEAPLSWDELTEKFRACAGLAATSIASGRIERFLRDVASLEAVRDVSTIIAGLRGDDHAGGA